MRAFKKSLIVAALMSAGISGNAESNQPVYWPAMAMMPVQFGNQMVMIPVSGWITPRGFLPAYAPAAGQPAHAGAPPPQNTFPAMPPFPGMAYPGMMQPSHNIAMQPGMPYPMPVPGQVQMPMPPHVSQGGVAAYAPGVSVPGMFAPGFTGGGAVPGLRMPVPMVPPVPPLPQQAQRLPVPGFIPPLPAVPAPLISGVPASAMDTMRAPQASPGTAISSSSASAKSATQVVERAGADGAAALPVPASSADAPATGSKLPEAPALRMEAAMVSVPVSPASAAASTVSGSLATANARDGDADGVANDMDLCPDKSGVAGNLGCPADEGVALGGIAFHYDSDELTDASKAVLDRLVHKLMRLKGVKLEVAGHTDSRGDALYNLDLSERRARAVRNYLVEQGVSPSRLIAKGYGQTKPLADNESREGRATNRRVELRPA